MGSAQPTLTTNTVLTVLGDAPAQRITLTMISGAAEVYASADGSYPTPEAASDETNTAVQVLAPLVGAQTVLEPPLAGDHMTLPTVKLLSAGTPVVLVEW